MATVGLQSHSGPDSKTARSGGQRKRPRRADPPRESTRGATCGALTSWVHSIWTLQGDLCVCGGAECHPGRKDPAVRKARSVPQGLWAVQSHPHAPFCEPRTRTRDSAWCAFCRP